MTQNSLFDLRPVSLAQEPEPTAKMQKGAGATGRPVDAGDAQQGSRASSDHAVIPPPQGVSGECQNIGATVANGVRRARGSEIPHFEIDPDVRRVIQHKAGPLLELVDGKPTGREFQILELRDGSYVQRFTDDGSRAPATKATTSFFIADCLTGGTFVVVSE